MSRLLSRFSDKLIMPGVGLMRHPNGISLLRTDLGGLAGHERCCCDGIDTTPCSFYYGRVNESDIKARADKIWIEFNDPGLVPSSVPVDRVPAECCENYTRIWELPIRDFDDADTDALSVFGICPGEWVHNCFPISGGDCYDPDPHPEGPNSTSKTVKATCGPGTQHDPQARCISVTSVNPDFETVWAVQIRIAGALANGEFPVIGCDGNTSGVDYAVFAPVGTVLGYGGEWILNKINEFWSHPTLGLLPWNPKYCVFPDTITLHTSEPL